MKLCSTDTPRRNECWGFFLVKINYFFFIPGNVALLKENFESLLALLLIDYSVFFSYGMLSQGLIPSRGLFLKFIHTTYAISEKVNDL